MRVVQYNRKINAPIRFVFGLLEVFDLFVLMVFGFLGPLAIASFLPVDIPLWHDLIWLVALTFLLVIIKVGRAPGFIQHWMGGIFRSRRFHPGKKRIVPLIINPEAEKAARPASNAEVFTLDEISEIQNSVLRLRQRRREAQLMASEKSLP